MDVLEVANAEHHATHAELTGICWALEYMVESVYYCYMDGSEGSTKE